MAIRRAARKTEPIRILFYHRVADKSLNDWTISSREFAAQIHWLRDRFDIVSLAEAQARIAKGRNRIPTVCVTFDDGYAENLDFAVPLLLQLNVPFTYFVSTRFVLAGEPFPHDVAAGVALPPNTVAQVRELAEAGVEVGAHTRTHLDLGGQRSRQQLTDEILGSKQDLEQLLGREVRYFAFPYGMPRNLSADAFRVVFASGFHGACSAYGGYNFPGDDPFHLQRFHADRGMARFKNWLTLDPRKMKRAISFDPGDYARP
jgi:peptidoglycan/xylan/chitin deacetylase (PgdA/CDA1 family)